MKTKDCEISLKRTTRSQAYAKIIIDKLPKDLKYGIVSEDLNSDDFSLLSLDNQKLNIVFKCDPMQDYPEITFIQNHVVLDSGYANSDDAVDKITKFFTNRFTESSKKLSQDEITALNALELQIANMPLKYVRLLKKLDPEHIQELLKNI